MDKKTLLAWYKEAGVDEAIGEEPVNAYRSAALEIGQPVANERRESVPAPAASPTPPTLHHSPSAAIAAARVLADNAETLAELENAVRGFDGCALKKTASKTVFCDGNPEARVMLIGEAPGAQEDVQGIPFCGASGKLLDRMLLSIGLDRSAVYITNTLFWRPPGNRQPSAEETATCLPFVEKHIALVNPALLILCGGTATGTLLRKDQSISRLRGRFYDYSNDYLTSALPVSLMYHPSYLLRSPAQKRLAWSDLLLVKNFLETLPLNG